MKAHPRLHLFSLIIIAAVTSGVRAQQPQSSYEYLWYEAENMRGFQTKPIGEPVQNPSWMDLSRLKAPGWGINGPGVSAEWSQGGESEWNSVAASADESTGRIYQDLEVPRAGRYRVWIRYADWANRSENFIVRILSTDGKEIFRHEFGTKDVIDPHDEVSMYWGWSFAWDAADGELPKGSVRFSLELDKAAQARRHVDCFLITNDLAFVPEGRKKPDFAAARYLRDWSRTRAPLVPLIQADQKTLPLAWQRPLLAGRDFMMPWNISPEFWKLYDKPESERPVFPFNAEPIEDFVQKYKGDRDVPIFKSRLVVPVIYINNLGEYLQEGSAFLRYVRQTKTPFVILINYGSVNMSPEAGQAAWKLLTGELKGQFLGWISGESVGYVWEEAPSQLKISPSMSRAELLEAHQNFYTNAIANKWAGIFHTTTGAMWDKLIPAQSTSSTSFAHALTSWGVKILGLETAAVQPMFAMRTAFTRGAVRQFGGNFLYYHAPNFGDTATTFTKQQNFAGPDNFFHSRYGPTMGPSLSWYRKSYYFYYMSGASAIYLEQGFDQFFKPGPGEHEMQLNPLGRITDEFMRFAEKHPNRGTPNTPVAFLLDPAHGWDMTDYPQWPFEVSQINRSDRALRELFGVAYYPGLVVEGEPATGDRQAFVNGIFGDIFDVLVANDTSLDRGHLARIANRPKDPTQELLSSYRAIVAGGRPDWKPEWIQHLSEYVRNGGTLLLNVAQTKNFPAELLGVELSTTMREADNARCVSPGELPQDLHGQVFRYQVAQLKSARALIVADNGDPLVMVNKVGRGQVVFAALADLLGEDERMTPFAAHMLAHVFSEAAPVKVLGDVEYLLNQNESGWIVTVINNNGVIKPQQGLATVDRHASANVKIRMPGKSILSATDWISDTQLKVASEGEVNLQIPPGGISIVELRAVSTTRR